MLPGFQMAGFIKDVIYLCLNPSTETGHFKIKESFQEGMNMPQAKLSDPSGRGKAEGFKVIFPMMQHPYTCLLYTSLSTYIYRISLVVCQVSK